MPSNHLILHRTLLLLPSVFPSIRVFSNESVLCIRWSKYWSFSFSISPSNEYSGLISFRMDWFDLFVVQGTLKSLLQHHSSKAPILQCSVFFIVQLSHPYMTTKKAIALTQFSLLQSLSRVCLFATTWTAACGVSLYITDSWSFSNWCPSSWWCHPTISSSVIPFSSCLYSFPASGKIDHFFSESVLWIRWPNYWSFSFSISPSNEYSGLISFRMVSWISLQSKGFARVFPNTTVQKHQFFNAQLSL